MTRNVYLYLQVKRLAVRDWWALAKARYALRLWRRGDLKSRLKAVRIYQTVFWHIPKKRQKDFRVLNPIVRPLVRRREKREDYR